MWGLDYKESWAPKNWCFWTVVLEKTLENPLDFKEIQPVILKKISEYSLEGLMLKLKLQYFGYLMWRTDSLEKTLMLRKIEGGRRRGRQRTRWLMASPTQWTWVWVNSGSWWWTGRPGVLWPMGSQRVRYDWATELDDWIKEAGFPGGVSGKEPAGQCRRCKRHMFDPWVMKIPWRRAWLPTPVFLPGESHGQRSLVGYSPQGLNESETTEA